MAKSSKAKSEIELVPDAWPRFEKFIKEIVKAPPQHRIPAPKPQRRRKKAVESKGRE